MKKALLLTIASLVMSMASLVNAASNPKMDLLKQLDQIEILAYDTTTNFLSYTIEENKIPYTKTQYYSDNQNASPEGDKLSASIDGAVTTLGIKSEQPIAPLWTTYSQILNSEQAPLVTGGVGGSELALDTFNIAELVKARKALVAQLDIIRKQVEVDAPAVNRMASSQSRKIKEIVMTYMARISPTIGAFTAIDAKFDVKAEAQKVSTLFDDLLSETSKNPVQVKLVADARTDWLFLNPVLTSDKKVQAESVVAIYGEQIVKLLQQM